MLMLAFFDSQEIFIIKNDKVYSWEGLLGEAIGEDAAMRVICNAARDHWDWISNRSRVAQPATANKNRIKRRTR